MTEAAYRDGPPYLPQMPGKNEGNQCDRGRGGDKKDPQAPGPVGFKAQTTSKAQGCFQENRNPHRRLPPGRRPLWAGGILPQLPMPARRPIGGSDKWLYVDPSISPRRRLYPPACKPYGLEAEPEAGGLSA